MQVYGSGVAVAMVACVPDWPWFNRSPQKWQPVQVSTNSPATPAPSGKRVKGVA